MAIAETPRSGRNTAAGPEDADTRSARRRPSSAHSSGVVRISVTDALWRWNRRRANWAGTVSSGPKFTMSSAPTRHDLGNAHRRRPGQPLGPGREHATDELVRELRRRHVEDAVDPALADELLERPAAGAGHVEDQRLEALGVEEPPGLRHAGRRDPEHAGADDLLGGRLGSGRRETIPAMAAAALAITVRSRRLRPATSVTLGTRMRSLSAT